MTCDTKGKCGEKSDDESWDEQEGWWSKAKLIVKNCSVEPLVLFYVLTSMLSGLCTQNLNLQKACRVNLGLDDGTCSALENRAAGSSREDGVGGGGVNKTDIEVAVQKLVADTMMWKSVLLNGVPLLLLVFVGSWSDRNRRRKPFILLPIAGEMLAVVCLLLCTYYELPIEITGLAETLFPALSVGWPGFFLAVFSYIGDVSSVKFRTLRIGIANIFFFVAMPIGSAVSGILFQKLGFYGMYILALSMYSVTLLYGIIFIKEVKTEISSVVESKEPPKAPSCLNFLEDFFSLDSIKEAIQVTFKEGKNKRKMKIISLMIVVIVVSGPLLGEISILYLYTRKEFGWNEVDYSCFATYSMVTNLLGTMFSLFVFSQLLKIDDALIGVMSCTSKIMGGLTYAFASTMFMFYMGPLMEIINNTSFIAMRSIISKLVLPEELGKVNSIFGVCEAIAPVIYGPMYSVMYKATLNTFPGMFFIVGSVLTLPAVIIFLLMYIESKKEKRESEEKKNSNDLENNSSSHKSDLKV